MNLIGWLHRDRDRPVNPIPQKAREVQRQADEISKTAMELRRMADRRWERKA